MNQENVYHSKKVSMKMLVGCVMLPVLLYCQYVYGDGISFEGNRITGHSTTVLALTTAQETLLAESTFPKMLLTDEQKTQLEDEAGYAPEYLVIYPLEAAQDTCTCEALNIGIHFVSNQIEIPHYLLGKDLYDRFKTKKGRTLELHIVGKWERIPHKNASGWAEAPIIVEFIDKQHLTSIKNVNERQIEQSGVYELREDRIFFFFERKLHDYTFSFSPTQQILQLTQGEKTFVLKKMESLQ